MYRYDPKFSDSKVWANRVDPEQIRIYTVWHWVCTFSVNTLFYGKATLFKVNRVIQAIFSGVPIFMTYTVDL